MIATVMAQAHIPGLSISLVKDNQVIYARGFGARNVKENIPATPHTLYGVGSCTKSFTALAIMQLVEKGKLDLYDPVSKYVPFKLGSMEKPITIHHLLTHSSGIPDLGVAEILISRMAGINEKWIPMSSLEDFLLHINGASKEVADEPGKRFFYFNSGYTILGEIIEKVSQTRYEEYIKENILKPLKMKRSTFLKEEFKKDSDVMTPYLVETKNGTVTLTPSNHPFHKFIYAPGGLLSSVMELSNYLVANMNGGIFEEAKIVETSLLEEMHKIRIETEMFRSYYGTYGREGYGYGWAILENFLGYKLVGHGGSTGVSSANLAFIPDLKIGVAQAANIGRVPIPIHLGALALLMGKNPEKEIPFFEIEKRLALLTGIYKSYKGVIMLAVVKKGPLLYLESKEKFMEMSVPLIPETDKIENLKFYIISAPGERMPVEFTMDSNGKIDMYIERHRLHKVRSQT